MAELYGWVGKILRADLTNGKLTVVPTSNYVPKFIGGKMVAAKIYWDEVPPEVKPYDPENRLIIMTGPLLGTLAPSATRTVIMTKSPEAFPESYMYSNGGSHWGSELKFAGYDCIIVQGKAPEPVYLWIHDGEAEIRSVGYLWGKVTSKVDEELKRLHGLTTKTMVIGPAGENLVKVSVIEIEGYAAAGMGGFGAVMGSKNLKAIAVRGTAPVKVARPKELMDLWIHYMNINPGEKIFLPGPGVRSFYEDLFPFGVPGPGTWLKEEVEKGNAIRKIASCWNCHAACLLALRFINLDVQSGTQQCNDFVNLMNEDWIRTGKHLTTDSWEFGRLCDDFGISVTNVLGHGPPWGGFEHHAATWAVDLVSAGIWTEENTGLPVGTMENFKVGTKEFNRALVQKVAYREGIGEFLAEGQQRYLKHLLETVPEHQREKMKEIYDKNVYIEKFHLPWQCGAGTGFVSAIMMATQPRINLLLTFVSLPYTKEMAIKYFGSEKAIDPDTSDYKVPVSIFQQHLDVEMNSLTYCSFAGWPAVGDLAMGAKTFSAITGIHMTFDEMLEEVGERGFNLERAILVREGCRREHDIYNDFTFEKGRNWYPDGTLYKNWPGLNKEVFKKLMDEYYTARGWDLATGIPRRSKLKKLDLEDVADDLEKKYGVTVSP